MVYQLELTYTSTWNEDNEVFVRRLEPASWDRTPAVGETITLHGLCLGKVDEVVWPIQDGEDVVIRLYIPADNEDLKPPREQLLSDGWRPA